ncbi:3,4-dihydroxy-2-butanone-4-phosphate synthase [Sphingomonas jeddahensis]|uniref:3,4-dihydroxy-2-butanone 4-phosphate synthase n=1 Tax=Sphingomonas jeddahensis TaxID=1915074 RepID=A0A1V2EWV6_9SPHN|nr:3,4-dihydroxy-2-butanone-4-phosphate synthase [Sphingomonas jeddahensis]ONF96669.1 Riboflavin biosynthesis protein RibBA [Sphingomonas jeddahensis]
MYSPATSSEWNIIVQKPAELARLRHAFLSTPEEIIDEAKNGRMFILVDDEDRENEGDLVIPAQMATPEKINFMARHGRGLICLAMTKSRVDALGLDLMSRHNGTRHETAFTVSIEARDGVTTGISAADRARTIAVAIDSSKSRDEIVTPGHVFPLVARDGGVLVRAGHTEAAVDVSRLAGLNPSGVICEIMNEDGTMSRMDDLVSFAQLHNLKIGTIRDLIAYRRRYDHLVEKKAEMTFDSKWGGQWKALTFHNKATGDETIALVKGRIDPTKPTLVRMHTASFFVDMFGENSERSGLLSHSMELIAEEGAGVIVVINRPMKGSVTRFMQLRAEGKGAGAPEIEELRDYGVGAQILADLGVEEMILLTNTHHTLVGLEGYGLSIVGERPIPGTGGE